MPVITIDTISDYQAALDEAVFFTHSAAGYLRIGGKDRLDFLNRQSSNDIHLLRAGHSITTVLTSPTARILDVLQLVDEGDTIAAITLAGAQQQTAQFLRGKIFFMDQVTVEDVSGQIAQIELIGSDAKQTLAALGVTSPPRQGGVSSIVRSGSTLHVLAQILGISLGYRMLLPADAVPALIQDLADAGVKELSPLAFEILRVEAGLPAAKRELTEDYSPLEASLQQAISETKGCYTGQEIIARQITYDKVTKHLVGLRLDEGVEPGTALRVEDKQVGIITSSVQSPRYGVIGLAYVKRPYHEPGTLLSYQRNPQTVQQAVVASLPFAD